MVAPPDCDCHHPDLPYTHWVHCSSRKSKSPKRTARDQQKLYKVLQAHDPADEITVAMEVFPDAKLGDRAMHRGREFITTSIDKKHRSFTLTRIRGTAKSHIFDFNRGDPFMEVDPQVGLVLSDIARNPMYVQDVLLTLFDGRPRANVNDSTFGEALWKLRAYGFVGWSETTGLRPAGPGRTLTELGKAEARRVLAANPLL